MFDTQTLPTNALSEELFPTSGGWRSEHQNKL